MKMNKQKLPRYQESFKVYKTGSTYKKTNESPKCEKVTNFFRIFWGEFCANSSIHALNQITKPIYSNGEKIVNTHLSISNETTLVFITCFCVCASLLWTGLFVISVLGATYTCSATWERYRLSSTSTVIESTRYPYSLVPFPAVIICDKSRVDWTRALALTRDDLPEPFVEVKHKLLQLLKRVAYSAFGDFDFFDQLRLDNETDFTSINSLNMTEILLKVMRPCEEVFFEWCWFRDKEYDCCQLFELQRTEFGFCWSFNSDTSEQSRRLSYGWPLSGKEHWVDSRGTLRPRRTAQFGLWSGIRFKVVPMTDDELPPDGNYTAVGVQVFVTDPKSEVHNNYVTVSPGYEVRLPVWGESLMATEQVRKLSVSTRKCLFPDEDPYGLPQGFYLASNCIAACYQNYTLKYCNCSPDFMFFNRDGNGHHFQPCNADGLLCLSKFNDIFTYEVPPLKSEFFPPNKMGINCTCLADCTSQLYVTDLSSPSPGNGTTLSEIDVHFRRAECTRYRTDVVYQWLDIVVSFGGIAGLFLGASLLSFAEIIYFCTIRSCRLWYESKKRKNFIRPFLR